MKVVIIILALPSIYFAATLLLPLITVPAEQVTKEEVDIYILSNGVHVDIVVPKQHDLINWDEILPHNSTHPNESSYNYLAIGWGDKGFYIHTPTWAELSAPVAFRAVTGLSSAAMHATYYAHMTEGERCRKIMISRDQYARLIAFIKKSFDHDENGNVIEIPTNAHYGDTDAFYEANGTFSLLYACNTWTNEALKVCGQKACLWTVFEFGIMRMYE